MSVTKEVVRAALARVRGPDMERSLIDSGIVSDIFVSGGKVIFSITVPADDAQKLEPMRQAAERVVSEIPGVEKAIVSLTAERAGGGNGTAAPSPRSPASGNPAAQGAQARGTDVPGVKHIIAVASGKGGVGKSTVAANLALALKGLGLKVGMLDADIYGPSQPRLLGVSGKPEPVRGRVLAPLEGYGLKVMSMGFMVEEDTPMIWRGPMVMSAITQMLREVEWGELDVLVVDMPPGTGDAQLTLAQQVPLSGAVIVSTPQDLALIDARKGINMFRRVDVPILGIVENMSYFLCPSCGERADIFGHGGARAEAQKIGVPFLGEVPLHMEIREQSDAGHPPVAAQPDGPHAAVFAAIAGSVRDQLSGAGTGARAAPAIVFD